MNNVYRVAMQDQVNGETFTFAVTYTTSGKSVALLKAAEEFGHDVKVIEVRRG